MLARKIKYNFIDYRESLSNFSLGHSYVYRSHAIPEASITLPVDDSNPHLNKPGLIINNIITHKHNGYALFKISLDQSATRPVMIDYYTQSQLHGLVRITGRH